MLKQDAHSLEQVYQTLLCHCTHEKVLSMKLQCVLQLGWQDDALTFQTLPFGGPHWLCVVLMMAFFGAFVRSGWQRTK